MKMMKTNIQPLLDYLDEILPTAKCELLYSKDYELVIAVMLSAQTTDKQVNVVTDKLFLKVKEPNDVLNMTEEKLAKQVSSVNYYKMKAKHIRETAKNLVELAENKNDKLTKKEKECLEKY